MHSIQIIVLPRPYLVKPRTATEADVVTLPKKRSRPPMPPMRTLPHLVRRPQDIYGQNHRQRPKLFHSWDSITSVQTSSVSGASLRQVKVRPARYYIDLKLMLPFR